MGALLAMMKYVLEGLTVDAPQMRANLDRLGGFLLSERVMFVLSDKVGKQTAHELVYEASMHGIENGISFEQSLMENQKVRAVLDAKALREALDPTTYVGRAPEIVDEVLIPRCVQTAHARKTGGRIAGCSGSARPALGPPNSGTTHSP